MDKLNYSPLRDSYTPELGDEVITTMFQSGMPRQRLGYIGVPHTANVEFILKNGEHDNFMSFYYAHRALPFGLRLFAIDGQLHWYECRFIKPPRPQQLGANVYRVSADIVINHRPYEL